MEGRSVGFRIRVLQKALLLGLRAILVNLYQIFQVAIICVIHEDGCVAVGLARHSSRLLCASLKFKNFDSS